MTLPRQTATSEVLQDHDAYQRERDLYRSLLELGHETDLEPLLHRALALIVSVVGARYGYLELFDHQGPNDTPTWSMAHALTPEAIKGVRARISRGIIAATIAAGETVVTTSAMLDPRFSNRESVTAAAIEGVLCAPIGQDVPRGVIYLQNRQTMGPFTAEDREHAEIFARHLAPLVGRLLAEHAHKETLDDPLASIRGTLRLDGVVGRSPALVQVLRQLALLAPLDVNVLLTGASGTGKSQIARVLHDSGPRANGPFVELNCAALPESLVESELFGALPGSHSGATRKMDGKVAAAEHGTLFLDEIADLHLNAQAKLLQLLQSHQYFPLGGTKIQTADIRVIAATNCDLERAVAERRFREDLLYRLQILPIRMPSLAERPEDIRVLARYICESVSERHRRGDFTLSPGAMRAIEVAEWPGNIRQLAHAIEAAAIRASAEGFNTIEPAHLFPRSTAGSTAAGTRTYQEATREFQASFVRRVLDEADWDIPEVARRLDVARSHVYNLIRAFAITRTND